MHEAKNCIIFFLCILLLNSGGYAQNRKFTGNFSEVQFSQFVHTVEEGSDYRFYYDPKSLDSFYVNIKAENQTLAELLQHVFQNTSFHFAIDTFYNVYITKHVQINTELPPYFFDTSISQDSIFKEEGIRPDALTKPKSKLSVENKLFEIGDRTNVRGKAKTTIVGYVRDAKNGEPISGATIYVDSLFISKTTDEFGYYSLTLTPGLYTLQIISAGMKPSKREVMLYSTGELDIDLVDYAPSLKTVVVMAQRNSNIKGLQMGVDRLSIKTIKQVPVVFGEADILKVVLTLPGVTSVGEASTGFNVRGGSADQNLILFNDLTIYNPSHLFGFFSAFNADVVKGVELYKSAIPERYGGRLSSVLDVLSKEGNSKKISGTGGIGPLTSRLMVEGPLIKDKTTFIASGRSSYSDWILHKIPNYSYQNSAAFFYDFDLHITHKVNNRNTLFLNGYMSFDQFRLNHDTTYIYSNKNLNIKWKHNFSNKLYSIFSGGIDEYQYSITGNSNQVNAYKLAFNIKQTNFRSDFVYSATNKHTFDFGLNSIYYQLHPGSFTPFGSASLIIPKFLSEEQGLENALYIGDKYTITPNLSINFGLRYSVFNYMGPHPVYEYALGSPRSENTIKDTLNYRAGQIIKTYAGPEYRFMFRYSLNDSSSIKLSYNSLRQYIAMLSNTAIISPTDVWKLSDGYIKPQSGDQISVGYYRNFRGNSIEASVEFYYKRLNNYMDYKSGAVILMNQHIETDVINSKGKAYGAELMIKKPAGRLNGWVNYTYSRTFLKTDDAIAGEQINGGKYYPANFDKPHNFNFIGNYRFSHRYSMSLNVVYNSGRPITLPIALFNLGGGQRIYYSDRNEYRIPDYFRTDLSVSIDGNHKIKKLTHNSWSFGVYNLTARKNAYSVYFIQENGIVRGYKLSIFGTAIPYITYNFRF